MSTDHDSYEQIARRRRGSADFREGYEEARRAFLIGQGGPGTPARARPVPDRGRRPGRDDPARPVQARGRRGRADHPSAGANRRRSGCGAHRHDRSTRSLNRATTLRQKEPIFTAARAMVRAMKQCAPQRNPDPAEGLNAGIEPDCGR
jgi:hypothetical protein